MQHFLLNADFPASHIPQELHRHIICTEIRHNSHLLSTVLSMNPFNLYWKSSCAASSLASPPGNTPRRRKRTLAWYAAQLKILDWLRIARPQKPAHLHLQPARIPTCSNRGRGTCYTFSCITQVWTGQITFVCHADGVAQAAAMTEGLNGGVLVTERLHMSMLPSWRKNKGSQTPTQKIF